MYGVPGGVYITPQQHPQQPRPAPAMFNRMGAVPVHGVAMGMGPHLANPHQQGLMQQRQQQQQQQVRDCGSKNFFTVSDSKSRL